MNFVDLLVWLITSLVYTCIRDFAGHLASKGGEKCNILKLASNHEINLDAMLCSFMQLQPSFVFSQLNQFEEDENFISFAFVSPRIMLMCCSKVRIFNS